MSFSIRDANRTDLPRIVAIYNSTIASRMVTADVTPVSVESREGWFAAHNPIHRPLWVCTTPEEEIAGWLSFSDFHPRCAYETTAELSIYLDEHYRVHGLGDWLLKQAIAAAPRLKVENIVGLIFGHNIPSIKLFANNGFEKWGYLPRVAELDGVKRDLVIMGKQVVDEGNKNSPASLLSGDL